jgi:hypothetical protein
MAKTIVISPKNLPARFRTTWIIAQYLLLVHFHAPVWLMAVWGTLAGVWVIVVLVSILHVQERVDILNEPPAEAPRATRWAKRMAEIQAEQAKRKNAD